VPLQAIALGALDQLRAERDSQRAFTVPKTCNESARRFIVPRERTVVLEAADASLVFGSAARLRSLDWGSGSFL
jgi:hypothetical protein